MKPPAKKPAPKGSKKPKEPEEDFSDFFSFEPEPIELAIKAMQRSTRAAFQTKVFVTDGLGSIDEMILKSVKVKGQAFAEIYGGTVTGRIKSENHPPLHNLPKRK